MIKKVKYTVPRIYVFSNFNSEEIIGKFYEKELQKKNQPKFRIDKVIKRNGDKLFIKWKCYDNYLIVELIKLISLNCR